MAGASRPAGSICSGCYNGFLPVVKHLQSLTARGHGFHEPCIQLLFASCWEEEVSYCPDSNTNLRRLKPQSIPNSCLGKQPQEVKRSNERAPGKFNRRNSAAESFRRCSKRETLRRLCRMVRRLQSKVNRLDRLQNDPRNVANEVSLERNLYDTPIEGSCDNSNQCNNLQVEESVKFRPSERQDKVFGNLKEEPFWTKLTLGPYATIIEGSDNLKAEDTLGTEHVLGSVGTTVEHCSNEGTMRCKKVDFAEPVDFSPNEENNRRYKNVDFSEPVDFSHGKENSEESDNLKAGSNLMYNEFALGSLKTSLGDIRGKMAISNSRDRSQSADPVNPRPGEGNIAKIDKFKLEDTSVTELALGPEGTTVEQWNIEGNFSLFNRSCKILSAEPLKFSPIKRIDKKSDSFREEDIPNTELSWHSVGTTIVQSVEGNVGLHNGCSKNQSVLKESASSSIGTVDLVKTSNKREFAKTWNLTPRKRNKNSWDNSKFDAKLETGPSLAPVSTTVKRSDSTNDPSSIGRCVAILSQMKDLDPFVFTAARDLFENPDWRKIFASLKEEKRLVWLTSMLPGVD